MLVRSSIRGNAVAAKSRCLSQVKKRYVTSARGQANIWRERAAGLCLPHTLSAGAAGQPRMNRRKAFGTLRLRRRERRTRHRRCAQFLSPLRQPGRSIVLPSNHRDLHPQPSPLGCHTSGPQDSRSTALLTAEHSTWLAHCSGGQCVTSIRVAPHVESAKSVALFMRRNAQRQTDRTAMVAKGQAPREMACDHGRGAGRYRGGDQTSGRRGVRRQMRRPSPSHLHTDRTAAANHAAAF